MISPARARRLRRLIVQAAVSLSDEDALGGVELFPVWVIDHVYVADERVQYNGKLYKCVMGHTSQADWTPDLVPALWTEVAKPGEIPVWRQPTGAQDAYRIGSRVWFPEKDTTIYISTIDYNTYSPDVYGWAVEA